MSRPVMWLGTVLVLCGMVDVAGAQSPSQAREQETAKAILAQMREASGGGAWNRVGEIDSESTILAGGRSGKLLVRYDLRTGANWDRVEMQDAGRVEEHNVDPAEAWSLDGAGDVTLSPGGKVDAEIDDLYIHRHGWWKAQFGGATVAVEPQQHSGDALCDVLSVHVPGGRGFTLWVDTKTHQLF